MIATGTQPGLCMVAQAAPRGSLGSELKSIASLKQRITEHVIKLGEYRANPAAHDNLGLIAQAASSEVRESIITGRIAHLEREIAAFQKGIADILGGR
jgi:hypothetical protein